MPRLLRYRGGESARSVQDCRPGRNFLVGPPSAQDGTTTAASTVAHLRIAPVTDQQGRHRLRTPRPVSMPGRPLHKGRVPHVIDTSMTLAGTPGLHWELYFAPIWWHLEPKMRVVQYLSIVGTVL